MFFHDIYSINFFDKSQHNLLVLIAILDRIMIFFSIIENDVLIYKFKLIKIYSIRLNQTIEI